MRTVKTAQQLSALRGDAPPPGPDHVKALADQIEAAIKAMTDNTAQHQAALLYSLKALAEIARKVGEPVQPAEKVLRWNFAHEYDRDGKIVKTIARAE